MVRDAARRRAIAGAAVDRSGPTDPVEAERQKDELLGMLALRLRAPKVAAHAAGEKVPLPPPKHVGVRRQILDYSGGPE